MTSPAATLLGSEADIAIAVVDREFERHPELGERYGAEGRAKALQDARHHLAFLAHALDVDDPGAFREYVGWAKVVLTQRNVRTEDLASHLTTLAEVLRERMPNEAGRAAAAVVTSAVGAIPAMAEDVPTLLGGDLPHAALAREFSLAVLDGDRRAASRLVLDAVAAGTPVKDVYLHVFQPSQYEIGRLWQTNRITVAEEHYCTAATQLVMSQLFEHVFASVKTGSTMVATSVAGNLHELGPRMVADFFEMDGWDTYYLGADTPNDAVVAALVARDAAILAVSAALPTHVEQVRTLIGAVRDEPACAAVKVLVGGRPFNRDPVLWRAVGADGFALSAQQAIPLSLELIAVPA